MNDKVYNMAAVANRIPPLPENPVVAMAYVPYQNMDTLYSAEQGLMNGTMFPVLNKPFVGCGGSDK